MNTKSHWESVYSTRPSDQLSWYEETPVVSLGFINEEHFPSSAKIIDVGGGDSTLVDHLMQQGFSNLTVVDISPTAIYKARQRLGEKCTSVKWTVADAASFIPFEQFDCWHDRAAFHFLDCEKEIANYVFTLKNFLKPGGIAILGTFSKNGPARCSGIATRQYSQQCLESLLGEQFETVKGMSVDHITPSAAVQNFTFCCFRKRA